VVDVAVVGAAGYSGAELVRWVLGHPSLELTVATSAADAGRRLADVYPALEGHTDMRFVAPDAADIAAAAELAFLAVPHTGALALAPPLVEAGLTVVDLSADFRLADPAVYEEWYGTAHTARGLLSEAVAGLPEVSRDGLYGARLVACPGCYPTASILAALPVLEAGIATGSRVVVDAKSGVSGAGRGATATTHFCSADESVTPYKVASHRHTPEITQALAGIASRDLSVVFTPHLVPMHRGLLSTVYLEVTQGFSAMDAYELYRGRYHAEPMVHVCEPGTMPSTSHVVGTNRAHIGVTVDAASNTLIAACAIDNLGKGASGQAVQCANAVFGLDESTGLVASLPPVV